jgi:hypothetical protein
MFSEKDKIQIGRQGCSLSAVVKQIELFKAGFPYLRLEKAASPGNGIIVLGEEEKEEAIGFYDKKIAGGVKPLKFVPASGAASRMFQSLYAAKEKLESGISEEEILKSSNDVFHFFNRIKDFAFYNDLARLGSNGISGLKQAIDLLLSGNGLNYGSLPKGLLKFHQYEDGSRTPFEEHLAEGALYAKDKNGKASLHFTVSQAHEKLFRDLFAEIKPKYEKEYSAEFSVGFSHQQPSTDTIAVDIENNPFRESDGSLLFRPAGHGALLENLNGLDADIIFVKNIDNVVPDHLKQTTVDFKKALAGTLLKYQEHIFHFQKELNEKHHAALSSAFLAEAANFLENTLNTKPSEELYYTEKEALQRYLVQKYNRPFRVCGMVKNEGEPGGGPFWARNPDQTVSLQIAESSQVDPNDESQLAIARSATHFNPVDLVCSVKNYKGEKYDLRDFTDPATGFISIKSKNGKKLKALELPGLWNGSMSNWNTLFAEVPVETFNPVKTIADLLRKEHQ